jgi:predicted RNA-binding protein YlqC (UPF0109 family)
MKYGHFVEYCVLKLVDQPNQVEVSEVQVSDTYQVRVRVAPDDAGKIIGRNGRLITTIRQVMSASANKNGERAYVKIITE